MLLLIIKKGEGTIILVASRLHTTVTLWFEFFHCYLKI